MELLRLPKAQRRFVVAEHEGRIAGAAMFVRDGSSVYYLYGATDREHAELYPSCALIRAGIAWACELGADWINQELGANTTLASFKASWGATVQTDAVFEWINPAWASLQNARRWVQKRIAPCTPHDDLRRRRRCGPNAALDELSAVLYAGGSPAQNWV